MKTLLLTFSGIALVVITAAAFQQDPRNKKAPQKGVAGPLGTSSTGTRIQRSMRIHDICFDPLQGDMHWKTIPEAIAMISEYDKSQYQGINSKVAAQLAATKGVEAAKQFADTRFVTFPMDTIKKFIWRVEQLLALADHKDSSGRLIKPCDLGIKFYYVAYPGLQAEADIVHTTKGRHTLLLVPTYWESKLGTYIEFFPGYVNETGRPLSLRYLASAPYLSKQAYATHNAIRELPQLALYSIDLDNNAGKNEGNLCPPPGICNAALLQMAVGLQR